MVLIKDYIESLEKERNSTYVVLFPNNELGAKLLSYHKGKGHNEIVIGDLFKKLDCSFPMPGRIVDLIKKIAEVAEKPSYVVGIDTYLHFLDSCRHEEFFNFIKSIVDKNKLKLTFYLSPNYNLASIFDNPKYIDAFQLIMLEGERENKKDFEVELVPSNWKVHTNFKGILEIFNNLGNLLPVLEEGSNKFIVAIRNFSKKIAGISKCVKQNISPTSYLKYLGIDIEISEEGAQKLLTSYENILDGLIKKFDETNLRKGYILKRLLDMDDDIWQAFIWMLQKKLPIHSYLHYVLSQGGVVDKDSLLKHYIVECPLKAIKLDGFSSDYPRERSKELQTIRERIELYIEEFVLKSQELRDEIVLPWLNVGLDTERMEVVRRASLLDLNLELSDLYKEAYSSIANYLSKKYSMGDGEIFAYFSKYRRLKIRNTVTEEFVEKAFSSIIPDSVISRDSAIKEYYLDENTALLVVDGLGAEYFSLLLATSLEQSLPVKKAFIAKVNLPTTTSFNGISIWPEERLLDKIKSIDNIAHSGAEKHEKNSFERNIVAVFKTITVDVMRNIRVALSKYKQVILTADHGTTRLGVIAYNKKLVKTLDKISNPDDWRFCKASGQKRPQEMTGSFHDGTDYWVVKGYNRLPKAGGKIYEMHGGATLEESLVPFIIYKNNEDSEIILLSEDENIEQIKEIDFNI